MLDITESMVADFGLPPKLRGFFGDGNQSLYFKEVYEPVVGAAIKRVVEERPFVIEQVLNSGLTVSSWGGSNTALADHMGQIASEFGLTGVEYVFGFEAGRQAAAQFHGDTTALLGILLLRDEPVEHILKLSQVAAVWRRQNLDYGEVWRTKKGSEEDWFQTWAANACASQYLATAIRLGVSVDECLQFMRHEERYLALGLAGVPLSYSLACGLSEHSDAEKVRHAWEDGLPVEYARTLISP